MSRIFWHSPSGDAALLGSERAWLRHICEAMTTGFWDLDAYGAFERAVEIVSMSPERPDPHGHGENYLHEMMRTAQAQEAYDRAANEAGRPSSGFGTQRKFIQALKTALVVNGPMIEVDGVKTNTRSLEKNTVLALGNDVARLAAKIDGWCESFCWFDGPDRAWVADLIEQGLKVGVFRRGVSYKDDDGQQKWISQGWEDVQTLLRSRDDEPVVLSYSIGESFPDAHHSDWMPPWPKGVKQGDWDALTKAQEQERYDREETWYELASAEQWERGMRWLKANRPWAQIAPDNLADTTFGVGVTILDLFAVDRQQRIENAIREAEE